MKKPRIAGLCVVDYSLHQLLRYMAAHSGWHLLSSVLGGTPSPWCRGGVGLLGSLGDGGLEARSHGRIDFGFCVAFLGALGAVVALVLAQQCSRFAQVCQ